MNCSHEVNGLLRSSVFRAIGFIRARTVVVGIKEARAIIIIDGHRARDIKVVRLLRLLGLLRARSNRQSATESKHGNGDENSKAGKNL